MQCPKCYQVINDSVNQCPSCGEVMAVARPASMPPPPVPQVLPPPNVSALRSSAPPIQINSLDEITPQTLPYIQQAVKFISLAAPSTMSGIFNIIFGFLITAGGVYTMAKSPVYSLSVLLGLLLVILGVWSLAGKPSVTLFKFDAVLYFIYGTARLVEGIIILTNKFIMSNAPITLFFAVLFIYYGFTRMKQAREFEDLQKLAPHEATVKSVREMMKRMMKSASPGVIDFSVSDAISTSVWKMEMGKSFLMVMSTNTKEVIITSRDQINIVPEASNKPKKTYKATYTIGEKQLKGTIKAEQLAKYQSWKMGAVAPAATRVV